MKTPCILVTIALIFLTPSRAAEKEPPTKLQTFEAKSGSIIVRGFSKIGMVRGKYGETVSVEARESRDTTTSKAAHGIILLAEENGTIARDGPDPV